MTAKVIYLNCLSVTAQGKINPDPKKLGFFVSLVSLVSHRYSRYRPIQKLFNLPAFPAKVFIKKIFSRLTLYRIYTYLNSVKFY